jgi:hypothetical protein
MNLSGQRVGLAANDQRSGPSLLVGNCEQEISQYVYERPTEKKLGRETDNTESNNQHQNKENHGSES